MRMRSRPVARLVPMSFISSCRFTSQAPRGMVLRKAQEARGLALHAKRDQQRRADLQLRQARAVGGLLAARARVSRNSERRRCSSRAVSQG